MRLRQALQIICDIQKGCNAAGPSNWLWSIMYVNGYDCLIIDMKHSSAATVAKSLGLSESGLLTSELREANFRNGYGIAQLMAAILSMMEPLMNSPDTWYADLTYIGDNFIVLDLNTDAEDIHDAFVKWKNKEVR